MNEQFLYRSREGFTLVEILISLVIVGILSGAMMMTLGAGREKAQATRIVNDMKTLSRAAQMAYADGVVLGADVTVLSPYVADKVNDREKYSLHAGDGYVYVKADLTGDAEGVRSRLAQGAGQWNLWQGVGGDSADVYADADAAFLPLNLVANLEGEPDFAYYFDTGEDHNGLPRGWYIDNGVLKDSGYGYYYFGDNSWTDYRITAKLDLGRNNGKLNSGYGINFRTIYEDGVAVQGYRVQLDPGLGGIVVRKVNDEFVYGTDGEKVYKSFSDAGVDPEGSHEIQILARGNRYVISVDGNEVLDFEDTGEYASGGTGYRTWTNGGVKDDFTPTEFDSIEVESLD